MALGVIDIINESNEFILTGGRRTVAYNVRQLISDMASSYLNVVDGGSVMQNNFGQLNYISPVNPTDYTPKQYVDLSILNSGGLSDYNTNRQYLEGQACFFNDILYRCTQNTSGTFNPSQWQQAEALPVSVGNLVESTSSILTISGGIGAVVGSGTSITVQQATQTTSGYLSSTDWNRFNSSILNTLTSGDILIGNASNIASAVSVSGDVSITNTGITTVNGILGKSLSLSSNGFLKYNTSTGWSIDTNVYALDSAVVHLANAETISGTKTFSAQQIFSSQIQLTSTSYFQAGLGNKILNFQDTTSATSYLTITNAINSNGVSALTLTANSSAGNGRLVMACADTLIFNGGNGVTMQSTASGVNVLTLVSIPSVSTTGWLNNINYAGFNASYNVIQMASISTGMNNITKGSEQGQFKIMVYANGALTNQCFNNLNSWLFGISTTPSFNYYLSNNGTANQASFVLDFNSTSLSGNTTLAWDTARGLMFNLTNNNSTAPQRILMSSIALANKVTTAGYEYSDLQFTLKNGSVLFSPRAGVQAGTSGQYTGVGGTIGTSYTPATNVGTSETTLQAFNILGSTLVNNGDAIVYTLSGNTSNTGNNKTLKFYFAGTNIFGEVVGSTSGITTFTAFVTIMMTSTTSVYYNIVVYIIGNGQNSFMQQGNLTSLTLTNGIQLSCTGTGTNNNDIITSHGIVEYKRAS